MSSTVSDSNILLENEYGCSAPSQPDHGHWICNEDMTSCDLECQKGYNTSETVTITCSDRGWITDNIGVGCIQEKTCPNLKVNVWNWE